MTDQSQQAASGGLCPHCGNEEAADTRFCTRCGLPLDAGSTQGGRAGKGTRPLLTGVVGVCAFVGLVIVGLFLLPPPHLQVPEIQPVVRVARVDDFPIGSSRMVTWGERSVLVVRREAMSFFAVEGSSPSDGCFLQWNAEALRIESPCTYAVYDLDGNVVAGLTRTPLQRYRVFERDGTLYVTEA